MGCLSSEMSEFPRGIARSRGRLAAFLGSLLLVLTACVGMPPPEPVLVGDMVGDLRRTKSRHDDVVFDIARKNDVGILEVLAANPELNLWVPGEGTRIVLPTAHLLPKAPREGIVVNVAELRLYYFDKGALVMTSPIGVGREGYKTPLGRTKVVKKQKDPPWVLTKSERVDNPDLPAVMPPGPDNPLGAYALRLGWPAYLIHGTNTPDGVGQRASRGCIRLYPEDIEKLYTLTPVGTAVRVVDQPVKIGTRQGELFLQVHPLKTQFDELSLAKTTAKVPIDHEEAWIKKTAKERAAELDWTVIRKALQTRNGIPVQITNAATNPVPIESSWGFF